MKADNMPEPRLRFLGNLLLAYSAVALWPPIIFAVLISLSGGLPPTARIGSGAGSYLGFAFVSGVLAVVIYAVARRWRRPLVETPFFCLQAVVASIVAACMLFI